MIQTSSGDREKHMRKVMKKGPTGPKREEQQSLSASLRETLRASKTMTILKHIIALFQVLEKGS